MDAQRRVRVVGPSRVVLAVSTGALVVLTSAATAFLVLSGTDAVIDRPGLEPLPPAAAPPAAPPVVVLPPGGLGMPVPELPVARPAPAPASGGGRSDAPVVLAAPPLAVVPLAPLLPELPLLPGLLPPADVEVPTPSELVVVPRVPVSAPLFGGADERDLLGSLRQPLDDAHEFRRRAMPAVPAKAQPGAANAGKSTADAKKQKASAKKQKAQANKHKGQAKKQKASAKKQKAQANKHKGQAKKHKGQANKHKAGPKQGPGKKSSARAHRKESAKAGARKGAGRPEAESRSSSSGHRGHAGQHRGHRP